jgi:hypothetical protein
MRFVGIGRDRVTTVEKRLKKRRQQSNVFAGEFTAADFRTAESLAYSGKRRT